jgi:hypothetical protein
VDLVRLPLHQLQIIPIAMVSAEQEAYDELKSIYRKRQVKFERALEKAGNDKRKRDAILRERLGECEA